MASSEEVKSLERVVEKLDDSIEKLTDISNNIGKLLAVHDQRLDTIEKDTVRNEDDIRDIHFKLENLVKDLSNKIDESMKASAAGHAAIQAAMEEKMKDVNSRLNTLETWKWWVVGAATAAGYFINKLFK